MDDCHYEHSCDSQGWPIIYSPVLSAVIINLKKAVRVVTSWGVLFHPEPDLQHSYFEGYMNFTSLSYNLYLNPRPGVVGGGKNSDGKLPNGLLPQSKGVHEQALFFFFYLNVLSKSYVRFLCCIKVFPRGRG